MTTTEEAKTASTLQLTKGEALAVLMETGRYTWADAVHAHAGCDDLDAPRGEGWILDLDALREDEDYPTLLDDGALGNLSTSTALHRALMAIEADKQSAEKRLYIVTTSQGQSWLVTAASALDAVSEWDGEDGPPIRADACDDVDDARHLVQIGQADPEAEDMFEDLETFTIDEVFVEEELERSWAYEDGAPAYYYYPAEITVTYAGRSYTASDQVWALAGWVRPGAHGDHNGSGLALWGDNQHGDWSVCLSDSQTNGAEELIGALMAALPESCTPDRQTLIDAILSEIPSPSEPDDEAIIDESDVDPDIGWQLITWRGARHLIWLTPDGPQVQTHPTAHTARDAAEGLADRTEAAIAKALDAREGDDR